MSSGAKEERKSLVVKVTEEDVELLIRAGIEFEEAASPEKQNFDTASKLKSNYEDVLCPTLRTDFKDIYGRYGNGSTRGFWETVDRLQSKVIGSKRSSMHPELILSRLRWRKRR